MSSVLSSELTDASLQVTVVLHSSEPTSIISAFSSGGEQLSERVSAAAADSPPPARTSVHLMGRLIQIRVNCLTSTAPGSSSVSLTAGANTAPKERCDVGCFVREL